MKSILIYIIALVFITKAYKLAPYDADNCSQMLSFDEQQTLVMDLTDDSHDDLKTCILKNIVSKQAIVLSNENYTENNTSEQRRKIIENQNVLIMTKNLSNEVLFMPSINIALKSHRSLVYFVLINDKSFRCINGTLNTTDFLILEEFMNLLWHSYKIMRVGVIFPFSCKEKIAIYTGKRKTNERLYDRTITVINLTNDILDIMQDNANLLTEDYPLRVNIFYRYPTAITECEKLHYYTKMNLKLTEGFCGLDALVMRDIVQHFKYHLYFLKDDECYRYGYATSSYKNSSGSLGCIVRKKLDISFNSRFMTMYSKDHIYFLHFVTSSALCGLVRQPDIVPIWQYAISVYRADLWLIIISLILAIGVLTWAVETLKHKVSGTRISTFYFYIEDAFISILFGFSLKTRRCLLRCICLCSSIMFGTIYQSHINYMFTTLLRFETIETLDGLYKSGNTLYVTPSIREIMKQLRNPENKLQSDFIMGARLITDNYTLALLFQHPHAAMIGRHDDAIMEIYSQYRDKYGSHLIDIVDECFYTYYLSFITRSGFPFFEEMQRFMQRIGEAGLPIIYHKWTYDMLGVPHSLPKTPKEPRPFAKINLENQRIPFGILIFGYVVSLIIFVIEIVKGRHQCRLRKRN